MRPCAVPGTPSHAHGRFRACYAGDEGAHGIHAAAPEFERRAAINSRTRAAVLS
jgi:hypothetical protein